MNDAVVPTLSARQPTWPTMVASAAALAVTLAWEASQFDLPIEQVFGNAQGFGLRDHWVLSTVLHDGARRLAWLLATALCIGVWWPLGPLKALDASRRLQLASSSLLAVGTVALLKSASVTSCPWDLNEFGGVARYVPHWNWLAHDGGSGRCFPAGHAASGFSFMAGWFAFSHRSRVARCWLLASLLAGFTFGLAQQARGAHFMSHTLWTAWICWMVAWANDIAWRALDAKAAA